MRKVAEQYVFHFVKTMLMHDICPLMCITYTLSFKGMLFV